jgi:hypothetical protein
VDFAFIHIHEKVDSHRPISRNLISRCHPARIRLWYKERQLPSRRLAKTLQYRNGNEFSLMVTFRSLVRKKYVSSTQYPYQCRMLTPLLILRRPMESSMSLTVPFKMISGSLLTPNLVTPSLYSNLKLFTFSMSDQRSRSLLFLRNPAKSMTLMCRPHCSHFHLDLSYLYLSLHL